VASLHRAVERGEITEAQVEVVAQDLARSSVEHYQRLPQAQAMDAILGLLLGEQK
jgi:hypothetical protein